MGIIGRKQKKETRLSKRLIITGIAAVLILLVLIVLLIMTGMEDMNLSLKGNIRIIEPIAIRIGVIALGTLLALVLITVLLRISAERDNADERMRILINAMPFGANFHDKNFDFFACNDTVANMFGFSNKQEYIDNFYRLSPEYQPDGSLSRDKIAENTKKAFMDGYFRFEWTHQKLNGEPIPCEVTLVRVKHGNEFALAAYVRDLREIKKIINEVEQREQLLNTVNSVASVLLSINDEKSFEASLLNSFELVGNCLDVDRVQIWCNEVIDDELHFVLRYQWLSDCGRYNIPVPIGMRFPYSSKPDWKSSFLRGEYINSPLSGLKEDDQVFLNSYGMKSIVIIPMFLEGNFWGFFSIDDCRRERAFSDDEMHILASAGLMMSSAVNRNMQSTKMREADERTQLMLDATPLCANFWDKNINHIDCNQEAVKLFGLSSKKEYSDRFFELSPEYQPDGRLSSDKAVEFVKKAFEEGYCRFEWMHQKLNGEPIPCEVILVRVEYKNDFIVAGYTRDLRELKTSIERMNKSEQSLSILGNILNSINAQVFVTVPHTGEILFANNFMREEFNVKGDCVGDLCYKIFMKDKDGICEFCPCYQLDKEPDSTVIWEMNNPVTNRIYHNATRYIEWSDGRTVQIQHSFDITELIEAKEHAEQSNRFKTQFLSRMSHEVRTPMNAILGITEIQLQDETIPPGMREAIDKIYNSGYLLLGIINDILDLSKIEAGKLELLPTDYDVPSLIYDTVQLTAIQYGNKPIDFNLNIDENIPLTLFGDELRIKQILNNLLSNAFKYTDSGEVSLEITAEYPQQGEGQDVTLVFRVADTGQGMTGEQLNKLFDEYTRFNMEANLATQGTGLGMNITRHLVNLMSGEISVESEPGKGSVFTVRLPQRIVGPGVLGRELSENVKQFNTGRAEHISNAQQFVRDFMPYGRVLIVDDVETNLYVARGLMAPYGLSIETATSGFEAVEKIKSGATFDIIFLDHFMPKMDGMEAARIIRDLGYTRPIVALTANALAGQAEMFMESGFDGFISKPIDIRQLNASLNKLIRDKYPPEVVESARLQAARINLEKSADREAQQQASNSELGAIFVRDAEKAFTNLKTIISHTFRRADDFRQFIINTHSMKSALANIGEAGLSSMAFKLELAGRAENIPAIESETPTFLEALSEVIKKNRPKEEGERGETADYDDAYLGQKLAELQTACAAYDKGTAKSLSVELKQKTWPVEVRELLDKISECLLHSDFEEAAKLAKDFQKPQ